MSPKALAREAVAELGRRADPERRAHAAGYFPTSMQILGVSAPRIREVLRPLARRLAETPPAGVLAVARELLAPEIHEARQLAFELLGRRRDVWSRLGRRGLEELGRGNDNWASVDAFATLVAGPAWRDGRLSDAAVHAWARSPDRWWRRTALVSTVPLNARSRGGSGDVARTLGVCAILANDADPMVAKGLSWALRALVAVDAGAVDDFVAEHAATLPARVRREVGNKLLTGLKNPAKAR